jgi:hypothetical protein
LIETYSAGSFAFTLPPPPLPTPVGGSADLVNSWLYAVDGTSANDVWAVGTAAGDDGAQLCLVDGDCDNSGVLSPSSGYDAPRNLRACGNNGHCIQYSNLAYHFDGTSWTRMDSEPGGTVVSDWGGPFLALTAFAPDSVDFFGNGPPLPGYNASVAIHWDGSEFTPIGVISGEPRPPASPHSRFSRFFLNFSPRGATATPGLVFTALRLSSQDEWLGGDGGMWHRQSAAWSSLPIPTSGIAACDNGYCLFSQLNGLRPDTAHPEQLWAVGTYVDFTQGAVGPSMSCDPTNQFPNGVSIDCNSSDTGTLSCGADGLCHCTSNGQCCIFGNWFGCGSPYAACSAGTCVANSGLNQVYSAHFDGASWSAVAPVNRPDEDQCLWSVATPGADLWAVGPAGPDTVANNISKTCFADDGQTIVEYRGAASNNQWTLVGAPSSGSYFGVDALPSAAGTRVLAVGRAFLHGTFAAVSQVCSNAP